KQHSTSRIVIQQGTKITLTLDLNGISDLHDVKEIGVKIYYPQGSSDVTDFYIDYLRF
ncbi:MAG: hypothetical protein GX387_11220, partial [Clostridium sp.]|nr:hypothetical protein [Clostridium sp.]